MLTIFRSLLGSLHNRWRIAALCCLPVLAAQQIGVPRSADRTDNLEREASFHIESGPLESALLQFSRQAGIQVVVGAKVGAFFVAAVDGRRNAREVLTVLLRETGLKFAVVGKTVTVYAGSSKRSPSDVGPVGGMRKLAPSVEDKRDPHDHV